MEKKTKGRASIGEWLNALTPEEKKEHYASIARKRKAYAADRKELKNKAKEIVPQLLAQRMIERIDKEAQLPQELVNTIRDMVEKTNMAPDEVIKKILPYASLETIENLERKLFKARVSSTEVVSNRVEHTRIQQLKTLKLRRRRAKQQIKYWKKENKDKKVIPQYLMNALERAEDAVMELEIQVGSFHKEMGVVGEEKKGSQVVHIHTSIPRPEPKTVTVDVPVQKLGDLIGD